MEALPGRQADRQQATRHFRLSFLRDTFSRCKGSWLKFSPGLQSSPGPETGNRTRTRLSSYCINVYKYLLLARQRERERERRYIDSKSITVLCFPFKLLN